MAEFSALPLFTDAFLADTSHLSDAECGLYLRLLMTIWRSPECRIPNDEAWLAKRFQRTIESCRSEIMPIIKEFCKSDGNWITQKRLTREYDYVKSHSKKQSDRAKSRWSNDKKNAGGYAERHQSGNAPTPTPTPTKKESTEGGFTTESLERAEPTGKNGAEAPGSFSERDAVSEDGQVIIKAAEISDLEKTWTNVKNIKGQIRNSLRLTAGKPPDYRKRAVYVWLGDQDQKAAERLMIAREKMEKQKAAPTKEPHAYKGQAVRP